MKIKRRKFFSRLSILLLSLSFLSMACSSPDLISFISNDKKDEVSAEISTPTESPTTGQTSDTDLLLFEDFSDMNSGWEAADSENSRYYYSDGEYFIETNNDISYHYIVSGDSFQDGILQIEMRHVSGEEESTGGMVFWRYLDEDNFYALTVNGNGSFNVHRFLKGTYGLISLPVISPALKTGGRKMRSLSPCMETQRTYSSTRFLFTASAILPSRREASALGFHQTGQARQVTHLIIFLFIPIK
jgi:hypothetical protein